MNIPAKLAIKHFFPATAFELVYSEAVANAFDAGATEIVINIDLEAFSKPDTLRLSIRDNGVGFTSENFDRFSNLMMVRDEHHKGLGRLVYLQYFESVSIESVYDGTKRRQFVFADTIHSEDVAQLSEECPSYTELHFGKFRMQQIKSYEYVTPIAIKNRIKEVFMPRLFAMKNKGVSFKVAIKLTTKEENPDKGFVSGVHELTPRDIADFFSVEFNAPGLDIVDSKCRLLYQIQTGVSASEHRLDTALCVDDRTIPFKVGSADQLPAGTSATFLLVSDFLKAKTNESRQELVLKHEEEEKIRGILIEHIVEILDAKMPEVKKRNEEVKESLNTTYPHLAGYFNQHAIGLINRSRAISEAQDAFCRDEKDILEAQDLTEEQYQKSLRQASRVLAQYILYRNKIVRKMESMTNKNRESDIHSLIVPMKRTMETKTFSLDLYNNNAWLLDDKYMTYQTILSDKQMQELVEKVQDEKERTDVDLRPDIAFVFSENIETANHPVDVVIVELKRKGLDYLDKHRVIEQIRQRARRLASLYPTKIQRMWFFGVIDFDPEMRLSLKEDNWMPLYSKGESYYKELQVLRIDAENNELPGPSVPVAVTLLSLDSLWKDARARNETFLSILRESIQDSLRDETSSSAG